MFRSQQGRGWLFGFRRPLPRCGWGILVSCFGTSLTICPNADLKQRSLNISIRLAQHLLLLLRLYQVSHRSGTIRGGSRQASQRHCDATQHADLQTTSKNISLPAGSLIGAILYSRLHRSLSCEGVYYTASGSGVRVVAVRRARGGSILAQLKDIQAASTAHCVAIHLQSAWSLKVMLLSSYLVSGLPHVSWVVGCWTPTTTATEVDKHLHSYGISNSLPR
jgi:hypothetical protein